MALENLNEWDIFVASFYALRRRIARINTVNINSQESRNAARNFASQYFRNVRLGLRQLAVTDDLVTELNGHLEKIFHLSSQPNAKTTYVGHMQEVNSLIERIAIEREIRLGEINFEAQNPNEYQLSENESLIYETLLKVVPTAGKSYRQALIDLSDMSRLSYRGPANELREALRELVDHFAPDKDVESVEGFAYEKDRESPTRRQKVKFILRSRGRSKNEVKAPGELAEIVEDTVAMLAEATIGEVNAVTHAQLERERVLKVKQYVDLLMNEILILVPQSPG